MWKLLDEIAPGDRVVISRTPRPVETTISDDDRATALLLGAFVSRAGSPRARAGFNNVDLDFFGETLAAYDRVVGRPSFRLRPR